MFKNLITIFVAVVILALAFGPRNGNTANAVMTTHLLSERARLRAHFDSVDQELRGRDVTSLTAAQRAARRELIHWLREYRDRGEFPLNDIASYQTPIFRDSRGVLCAMAYLINRSGRSDIVARVASTRNTAYIRELADDRDLLAWLDSTGLSVAEAARIQPVYDHDPFGPIVSPSERHRLSTGYAVASALISSSALSTGVLNLSSPDRAKGILGLVTGMGAMTTGLINLDDNGAATTRVAVGNLIVGAAATGIGLHAFLRRSEGRDRAVAATSAKVPAQISIAPGFIPTVTGPRLGLVIRSSF